MADEFVRKDMYEKDLGHFDERLDQMQVDLREIRGISLKLVEHDGRLSRLENGVKVSRQRNWKLWQIIIAAVCGGGVTRVPDFLAWLSKLKP